MRGNVGPNPKVYSFALRRVTREEISCPTVVKLIGFRVERPEKFRIGEKNRIEILLPKMKQAHVKFEVGWKSKTRCVSGITSRRLEMETPILEEKDELVIRLKDTQRPEKQTEFTYPIDVEPLIVKAVCKMVRARSNFNVRIVASAYLLDRLETRITHESSQPVAVSLQRISSNAISLKGFADKKGKYSLNLQSSVPFKNVGDREFYARMIPELTTDKTEYEKTDPIRIQLTYDPAMNVETIRASVCYFSHFVKAEKSVEFRAIEAGKAETVVQELPPCTAEISAEVVYPGGIKDFIQKTVNIYGVNLVEKKR